MIDRCSNKVEITSQDRLQPMDKWEDYPIKVLDMASLIMVTLPTVSSFFSTCGWCFLRVGQSSSGDLPPLSLACGWPLGANGSLYCEWRHLQGLRVEDPSGARKGGPNRPRNWARPACLGRLAQAHHGPARSPLRSRGSSCIYALCPLHLHYFDDVILVAWSPVFTLQSSGMFLRNTSVLSTIGSDFIKLMNTNKTP
jgi:hypothetical protein